MAVSRSAAITGEQILLTIEFREDETNNLFDPYSVDQVQILSTGGGNVIETISSGDITRIGLGQYQITISPIFTPGIVLDKWFYKLSDGGPQLDVIEATNITQAPTIQAAVESAVALPRYSAVVLRPILLTMEFRDDKTGELFDPFQVRQVEILENDGLNLIETITTIVRVGIGIYRIQAAAVSTAKTILDRWYFTAVEGEPERTHVQDTQVNEQSVLGSALPVAATVPEQLLTDIGPHEKEIVLIDEVKRIGITFKDVTGQPADPKALSLKITDLNGNLVLEDTYSPDYYRDPDPPRILNPSAGRYEFPIGLDNDLTSTKEDPKKNKTTLPCDFLFIWRASSECSTKASVTIVPSATPDNTIVWTSVADGTPGNFITVTYIDPSANDSPLSIERDGSSIVVNLATDNGGVITSTADEVIAAVTADTETSEIVTASLPVGGVGTGILAAIGAQSLSGGDDGSEQLLVCENVKVITERVCSLIPKLRLQIDKAVKYVDTSDHDDPVYLGYTDGQLVDYLEGGLQIINAYQPSGSFTLETFPHAIYGFILLEAALMAGIMSQQLFAVDTDIPSWSDQGNAFVIQHQPQLASYLNWLTQRLDKQIQMFKLNFVTTGSLHVQAGPNFRLNQLISAAPSGALFRNLFFKG